MHLLVMSYNGGTTIVVLPDGERHSGPLHATETATSEPSAVIADVMNGGLFKDDEDEDGDDDEEEAKFLQELRERRNMDSLPLQVVVDVEVCTDVYDTA